MVIRLANDNDDQRFDLFDAYHKRRWIFFMIALLFPTFYLVKTTQAVSTFQIVGTQVFSKSELMNATNSTLPPKHEEQHHETLDSEVSNPFSRVILMAQFNTDQIPAQKVLQWVQTMEPYFGKVLVRGEFWNATIVDELRALEIDVELSDGSLRKGKPGFFTPLNNMKHVLLDYHNRTDRFDGVLYIHDDSIPNLPTLAQHLGTKDQRQTTIVGTDLGKPFLRNQMKDHSYEDPREEPEGNSTDPKWFESRGAFPYRIYPLNQSHAFTDYAGNKASKTAHEMNQYLDQWGMRVAGDGRCMLGQQSMAKDPTASQYLEGEKDNPYMLFPAYTQADLLYAPLSVAETFADLASLLIKHGVWIECAFGTVVDQIRRKGGIRVRVVPLCTSWGGKRGKIEMVQKCLSEGGPNYHGFYHPVKPGRFFQEWQQAVQSINAKILKNQTG